MAFKDTKNFYKQFTVNFTVNYLLNPGTLTRPKVNTERSQMNNSCTGLCVCILIELSFDFSLSVKAAPHECVIRTSQP